MPLKPPSKFDHVLFVRVDQELLRQIDAVLQRYNKHHITPMSRAALVRTLLWDGLKQWTDEAR